MPPPSPGVQNDDPMAQNSQPRPEAMHLAMSLAESHPENLGRQCCSAPVRERPAVGVSSQDKGQGVVASTAAGRRFWSRNA